VSDAPSMITTVLVTASLSAALIVAPRTLLAILRNDTSG